MISFLSCAHAQPAHLEAIGWDTPHRAFQLRLADPSDARLRVDYSDDLVMWEFLQGLPLVPAVPPFDHIGINWNPNGHPPAGVYNRPHFDVPF